jgi:hypothetical protein
MLNKCMYHHDAGELKYEPKHHDFGEDWCIIKYLDGSRWCFVITKTGGHWNVKSTTSLLNAYSIVKEKVYDMQSA